MAHAEVGDAAVSTLRREDEVEVLLATYNGERFLREQIESILAQSYPALRILARDDGSVDGTRKILEEYAEREAGRFRVLPASEPTGGAKGNFARLMGEATADYACFADQDDVWLPDKVRLTVEAMGRLESEHGRQTPLLVFTDLAVVDEELRTIQESMWAGAGIRPESVDRLERLLGQNVVTGCTAMVNRRMLDLARRMPEQATMHDRWMGLLGAALGAAEAVRDRTVLYRQHESNAIGALDQDGSLRGIAARAEDDRSRRMERWRSEQQAEALLKLHGAEMPSDKRRLVEQYLRSGRSESRLERVAITLRCGFFRSGVLRNAAMLIDLWRGRTTDGLGPTGPAGR